MLFAGQIYVKVFFFILLLFDYIAEKEKVFTPWIKQENLTSGQAYLSGSYHWRISPNQYYCCSLVAKWVSQLLACFHFGMVLFIVYEKYTELLTTLCALKVTKIAKKYFEKTGIEEWKKDFKGQQLRVENSLGLKCYKHIFRLVIITFMFCFFYFIFCLFIFFNIM